MLKLIYNTRFVAGEKDKQIRKAIFDHLPEFSYVYYTCADCGEDNYSCLDYDKNLYKAHFGNRNGEPICYMCWKKILEEEHQRVLAILIGLKVADYISIYAKGKRHYFRRAKKLIMVSTNQYYWRRYKPYDAVDLWRRLEAAIEKEFEQACLQQKLIELNPNDEEDL